MFLPLRKFQGFGNYKPGTVWKANTYETHVLVIWMTKYVYFLQSEYCIPKAPCMNAQFLISQVPSTVSDTRKVLNTCWLNKWLNEWDLSSLWAWTLISSFVTPTVKWEGAQGWCCAKVCQAESGLPASLRFMPYAPVCGASLPDHINHHAAIWLLSWGAS